MSDPVPSLPGDDDQPLNVIALRGVGRRARYGAPGLVVAIAALGLGLLPVQFQLGALVFSLALVVALVLRIVLPTRRAGLLVVRTKAIDVAVLAVLAGALLVLTLTVPAPN